MSDDKEAELTDLLDLGEGQGPRGAGRADQRPRRPRRRAVLFRKPQRYADFLGQEIIYFYRGPLLVVMPNGYGIFQSGKPLKEDKQMLAQARAGRLGRTATRSRVRGRERRARARAAARDHAPAARGRGGLVVAKRRPHARSSRACSSSGRSRSRRGSCSRGAVEAPIRSSAWLLVAAGCGARRCRGRVRRRRQRPDDAAVVPRPRAAGQPAGARLHAPRRARAHGHDGRASADTGCS